MWTLFVSLFLPFRDLDQSQHSEDPKILLQNYLNFNQNCQEHDGLQRMVDIHL